jgi:hypothetical protein
LHRTLHSPPRASAVFEPARKRAHRSHTGAVEIKIYWGFERVLLIKESQRPRSGLVLDLAFGNLRAECHGRLNANRVENLLESGNRDGLVIGFFIAADHLLADAQPPRQLGL